MTMNRFRLAVMTTLVVIPIAVQAATAAAGAVGLPGPPPVAPPPGEFLDTDAKPAFTWTVPSRYGLGWAAAQTSPEAYADYANPGYWSVSLDGCASTSLYKITSYTFTISGNKSPGYDSPVRQTEHWEKTTTQASCRLPLTNVLPWQGDYQVRLTLHTSKGVSLAVTKPVTIRDILVVSIGDSFASGEGNPQPAISATNPTPGWKDKQCHRSSYSGPALAADRLENASAQTSVTFISVACSGASIANLIDKPYGGIDTSGTQPLAPQIDQVKALIGPNPRFVSTPTLGTFTRTIDHLLITAGLNDVGFTGMVRTCAMFECFFKDGPETYVPGGVVYTGLDAVLTTLAGRYTALDQAIDAKLPRTRQVYLSDYPAGLFIDGSKGLLGGDVSGVLPGWYAEVMNTLGGSIHWSGQGISASEGQRMLAFGNRFNSVIFDAVTANGWNRLGSGDNTLTQLFLAHGYASEQPWFNSYEDSQRRQGDENGTVHPNGSGAWQYGTSLLAAINAHAV